MRISVKLIQYDLLEDKKQILLETNALYDGNTLRYREGNDGGFHQVYFGDDLISFERKADVHTKITLFDDKNGESTVDSQYGKMYMHTRLCHAERCDEYWSVEYQLISSDEVILHQKLRWEFNPVKNI
ncbi:hypothetical protein [Solobacterium moorei]|uniref:hypothetical protein n=1 Tax=Solobacterium moorei TaxID=102148 RepID=UPI0028F0EC04|nr:hypothetical protein [Solobacterium moorei]